VIAKADVNVNGLSHV